jgi:hypothetical protein
MLEAIALLGRAVSDDPLKAFVDRTNAKDVFVIRMDDNCRYLGLTIENNQGEDRYLYKREKGGLPGKFLTGKIRGDDMNNLKKNLQQLSQDTANQADLLLSLTKFKKNKIAWVKKQAILKNKNMLEKIPRSSVELLRSIVEEIIAQQDRIMDDFLKLIGNILKI